MFASIDWHDFVIVGLIEFTGGPDEAALPPPVVPEQIMSRSLAQKKLAHMAAPAPAVSTAAAAAGPAAGGGDDDMEARQRMPGRRAAKRRLFYWQHA